ncbi:MAG: hypothetical protein HY897_15365 [Deltaproteobacteria bacterium]|nr:hypothetical protein [Deltaproteobacteria bacterium]
MFDANHYRGLGFLSEETRSSQGGPPDWSVRCGSNAEDSDRTGVLAFGFFNNTTNDVHLAALGAGKIGFFMNIHHRYDLSTCPCTSVGYSSDDPCQGCDLGVIYWQNAARLQSCEMVLSKNSKWNFADDVEDGYKWIRCSYDCMDVFEHAQSSCQLGVPIRSGTYDIAFCAADRAIPFEQKLAYPNTTAASLVCPEGYTKVLKTILVGKEDSLVVVPIEAADLSSR